MKAHSYKIARTANGWCVAIDQNISDAVSLNVTEQLWTFHNLDACLKWLGAEMRKWEFLNAKKAE